ncbi:ATP synthase F1 subunit epsilon [Paludisphaera sp.]|uniref:ATP synthase F1 subunit epsilon n=1 Tax=Paludisphaera sp. TaxID=2017432 RepID=UPI00301DA505
MADAIPTADHGATSSPTGPKSLQCQVVTPEKTAFAKTVDFVALPLYDGELGVLPGRAPLLGRLGFGELRIKTGDAVESYFVDGGFAQVRDDVVTVLTSRAVPAAKIEMNGTAALLDEAQKVRAATEAEAEEKSRNVARLRAMMHVSRKA